MKMAEAPYALQDLARLCSRQAGAMSLHPVCLYGAKRRGEVVLAAVMSWHIRARGGLQDAVPGRMGNVE